jgi:hypothetical protein
MPKSRPCVSRFWAVRARALVFEIAINGNLDFRGHFLNPKSPLTHLNENRGFYDSRFQVCAAAAS